MKKLFDDEARLLIEKRSYSEYLLDEIKNHGELLVSYVDQLLKNAASSQFDTANEFARAIDDLDQPLAKLIDSEKAFQLIVAVIEVADWGAFGSKALVGSKFSGMPKIRDMAVRYVNSKKKAAREYFQAELTSDLKFPISTTPRDVGL